MNWETGFEEVPSSSSDDGTYDVEDAMKELTGSFEEELELEVCEPKFDELRLNFESLGADLEPPSLLLSWFFSSSLSSTRLLSPSFH